jgi:hypothetical protein
VASQGDSAAFAVKWPQIFIYEARERALLVPQPTAGEMNWITRPESALTLDDIDWHKVTTVLGKGAAQAMKARR